VQQELAAARAELKKQRDETAQAKAQAGAAGGLVEVAKQEAAAARKAAATSEKARLEMAGRAAEEAERAGETAAGRASAEEMEARLQALSGELLGKQEKANRAATELTLIRGRLQSAEKQNQMLEERLAGGGGGGGGGGRGGGGGGGGGGGYGDDDDDDLETGGGRGGVLTTPRSRFGMRKAHSSHMGFRPQVRGGAGVSPRASDAHSSLF
jgi:membrane protein involved in colicin uptake